MAELIEITGPAVSKSYKGGTLWRMPAKIRNTVNGEVEVQTGSWTVFNEDEVLAPGQYQPVFRSIVNRFGSIEARSSLRPVK